MRQVRKKTRQSVRGVTVLEVLIAVFVLLVGMTGVIALFPVGVTFSQRSADDVISAMTAQNALAAVRVELDLIEGVDAYVVTDNENGDVLSWKDDVSRGVDGVTGVVATVGDEFGDQGEAHTHMDVTFDSVAPAVAVDDETFAVKAGTGANNLALMLMTSGKAAWKLYRLDAGTDNDPAKVASTISSGVTSFPRDGIKAGVEPGDGKGDKFRLIGARDKNSNWATVPEGFYDGGTYTLGKGAAEGYGYLAIVNRVTDISQSYRVTILVYKGYDEDQPPEGNRPAIACYVTILSKDLLR